jgi:hypothetical protein
VAGTRPLERSVHFDVLTHLAADPLAVVLRPAPLTEAACADIVEEVLSTSAHPAFCAACHALSGGNPLWLGELVEAVAAKGLAPVPASIGRLRPLGAQAVRRAVAARLASLPAAAVAMARALAVLDDGAQFAQAATLACLDEDTAFAGVLALQGADVLATEPPLAFVHPVVRAAVEAQLSPPERGRAHRKAATLLAHEGTEPERVAAHLLKAPTQGDPEVVGTLREAARRALARGAPESGVAYLARALREPPPEADRAGLLIELGLSENLISRPAAAEHLAKGALAAARPQAEG